MTFQTYRIIKRKRIYKPGDQSVFIDVPVVCQGLFKTMAEQAQESIFYFDNTSNSSRTTHVHRVINTGDSGQYADFERIDSFFIKDAVSQAQEFEYILKNNDPPPRQPDGSNNPAHEKVRYVRYYSGNDTNSKIWLDVELIEQLKIHDAVSQHQDWQLFFEHPPIGEPVDDPDDPFNPTIGFCDPAYELIASAGGIDPPYRLDPLTNPVNIHWQDEQVYHDQWFVWRRWSDGPLRAGDWYPVTNEFVDECFNAGECYADHTYPANPYGHRIHRSDLIEAAAERSDIYTDGDPVPGNPTTFKTGWDMYDIATTNLDIGQPNSNNPIMPNPNWGGDTFEWRQVYIFAKGTYSEDDLGTGQLDDYPPPDPDNPYQP